MAQKKRKKKQKKLEQQKKSLKPLIVKIGIATIALLIAVFFIFNNCDDEPRCELLQI